MDRKTIRIFLIIVLIVSDTVILSAAGEREPEPVDEIEELGAPVGENELREMMPEYYAYEKVLKRLGPVDLEASMKRLPKSHPAYGMKPGEIKYGDIFIQCGPDPKAVRPPYILGVPKNRQPLYKILESTDFESEEIYRQKQKTNMLEYYKWYASFYGGKLGRVGQEKLASVYIKAYEKMEAIRDREIPAEESLKKTAAILAETSLIEYSIYKENRITPPASNPFSNGNYRDPLFKKKVEDMFYKSFLYYTDREYRDNLKIPVKEITFNRDYYQNDSAFLKINPREVSYETVRVNVTSPDSLAEHLRKHESILEREHTSVTTSLSDAELLYYDFRVYSAEHPVVSDWETVRHVSIVGGCWVHLIRKKTVTTVKHPENEVIDEKVYTLHEELFVCWLIGNGCLGDYKATDSLKFLGNWHFSTYDAVRRKAYGVEPYRKSNGVKKHYPMRACAYCVGTYGVTFFCHNNANAFTVRKWNWAWIDDPDEYQGIHPPYGLYGVLGISNRTCLLSPGVILKGGIPGSGLHYNIPAVAYLPHTHAVDLAISTLIELAAPAWGYGLGVYYNAKKNDWRSSGAKYTPHLIPPELGLKTNRTFLTEGWP
ncbi:MAG: hypothetical protein JW881_07975 [Spirochaetales bacterium]|nr:hypothetical protein [Spirochaetales bacterium]